MLAPATGPLKSGFFAKEEFCVNIFIYSDESGVFDATHNDYYVFGGIMFFSKDARDICARKYSKAENDVRRSLELPFSQEIKASVLPFRYRDKLYRSLNKEFRFGVIINESRVLQRIFKSKKDKQRYLDYVYKIAIKRCFEHHIASGVIDPDTVENIYIYVDEHTTATNGRYELQELLEREFINGTYNADFNRFFPPLFPKANAVQVSFCNSAKTTLVRSADIIANKLYYHANSDPCFSSSADHLFVIRQP